MLIFAHRGCHTEIPENTLAAFEQAVIRGVDGIETDLRLSRAGEIVLFHDRQLPDGRRVADLTRDELSRAVGFSVPTLEEALHVSDAVEWNLELKTPAVLDAAAEVISRYRQSHRILATSFWHTAAVELRRRISADCGRLLSHRPISTQELGRPVPGFRTLVWNFEFVDGELIRECSGLGYRNLVFGVASATDHEECRQLPLDGVITDFPEYFLPEAARSR